MPRSSKAIAPIAAVTLASQAARLRCATERVDAHARDLGDLFGGLVVFQPSILGGDPLKLKRAFAA